VIRDRTKDVIKVGRRVDLVGRARALLALREVAEAAVIAR
jgi:acyl-coenzyme A synthetase/AMP-(fatty) acid ligase